MRSQKEEKTEEILYNVKPVIFGNGQEMKELLMLYLGPMQMECPFMTVHGVYAGGDRPQAFAKQACSLLCTHATLREADDGKTYWRITCGGQTQEREVVRKDNSKIQTVATII